jgi:DNA-directed RNA polymerase specialized sigma24 family protein
MLVLSMCGNFIGKARHPNGLRGVDARTLPGGSMLDAAGRMTEEGKLPVEELYARHAQGAVRLAYLLFGDQEVAQDIAQEAFLRAFGRFADMRKPSSFSTYLKTTIVNLTRKHFRRRGPGKALS